MHQLYLVFPHLRKPFSCISSAYIRMENAVIFAHKYQHMGLLSFHQERTLCSVECFACHKSHSIVTKVIYPWRFGWTGRTPVTNWLFNQHVWRHPRHLWRPTFSTFLAYLIYPTIQEQSRKDSPPGDGVRRHLHWENNCSNYSVLPIRWLLHTVRRCWRPVLPRPIPSYWPPPIHGVLEWSTMPHYKSSVWPM